MKPKDIIRIALATTFLLLVPLSAMHLTDEVAWSPVDFAVAGLLLFSTGLTYQFVSRKRNTIAYRIAVGVALAVALFLVWVNLAVGGIIGEHGSSANLVYLGILAVGIGGAVIVHFQSQGMARALFATALAHALVTVVLLVCDGFSHSVIVNGFFVAAWVGSGLLFHWASREDAGADPAT